MIILDDEDVSNLRHRIIGGGNAGLEFSADINNVGTGYVRFDVANSEAVRIVEGGSVGIGTSSPPKRLHVSQSGTAALIDANTNGNVPALHVRDNADTFVALFEGNRAGDTGAAIHIYHNPATSQETNRTRLNFEMNDSGDTRTVYAQLASFIDDHTDGTEDGHLKINTMTAGSVTEHLHIGNNTISGSAISTGSFAIGRIADRLGVGIHPAASNNIHIGGGANPARMQFTNTATGNTTADGVAFGLDPDNSRFYFWNYENYKYEWATNNTSVMELTNAGTLELKAANAKISGSATSTGSFGDLHINSKIGVGTTDPDYQLEVIGNARISSTLTVSDDLEVSDELRPYEIRPSGTSGVRLANSQGNIVGTFGPRSTGANASGIRIEDDFNLILGSDNDYSIAYNATSDNLVISNGVDFSSQQIQLDPSGLVGINTGSMSAMLEIVAHSSKSSTSLIAHGEVKFRTTSNDASELRHLFNMGGAGDPGSYNIYQGDASTIGVHLDAGDVSYLNGGDVGIGVTAPDEVLHIKHTEAVIKLEDSATTGAGYIDFDGGSLQLNTNRNPNTGAVENSSDVAEKLVMYPPADKAAELLAPAPDTSCLACDVSATSVHEVPSQNSVNVCLVPLVP